MAVTPKVRSEGSTIIIEMGTDRLELDLFCALKLSADLADAGRELMKP